MPVEESFANLPKQIVSHRLGITALRPSCLRDSSYLKVKGAIYACLATSASHGCFHREVSSQAVEELSSLVFSWHGSSLYFITLIRWVLDYT